MPVRSLYPLARRLARPALECLESRNLMAVLPYGGIVSDAVAAPSGFVDYTFSANAGEQFALAMTSTPTQAGFDAYADLLAPSGTAMDHFFATGQRYELPAESGTYTVRVH